MSSQELQILEEKIAHLIQYCNRLKTERDELAARDVKKNESVQELEEKIANMNEERETVRSRVSSLIAKIDELGKEEPEGDSVSVSKQAELPLGSE